jgi:hypothetical protein
MVLTLHSSATDATQSLQGTKNASLLCHTHAHASIAISGHAEMKLCDITIQTTAFYLFFLATHARRNSIGSSSGWVNLPVSYVACLKRGVQVDRKQTLQLSLNIEYKKNFLYSTARRRATVALIFRIFPTPTIEAFMISWDELVCCCLLVAVYALHYQPSCQM